MVLKGSHISKDKHLVNSPFKHFGISLCKKWSKEQSYLRGEPTHLRPAYLIYAERV